MIDYFDGGGKLFDGRATDLTDRKSHAYKLGYCISALEGILAEASFASASHEPTSLASCVTEIKRRARAALTAIGHEHKS